MLCYAMLWSLYVNNPHCKTNFENFCRSLLARVSQAHRHYKPYAMLCYVHSTSITYTAETLGELMFSASFHQTNGVQSRKRLEVRWAPSLQDPKLHHPPPPKPWGTHVFGIIPSNRWCTITWRLDVRWSTSLQDPKLHTPPLPNPWGTDVLASIPDS